jgi:hypothetical protein
MGRSILLWLIGRNNTVEPRLGVLMNPYTATPGAAWQPFISGVQQHDCRRQPRRLRSYQVFGLGSVSRISSSSLKLSVDLAAIQRDADNVNLGQQHDPGQWLGFLCCQSR